MAKIATWNVNSIKARLPNVLEWLRAAEPDVLCMQEIKCVTEAFPRLEFEDLGYSCAVFGQKTYNGVAILARGNIEDVREGLPGLKKDEQARYIEASIDLGTGKAGGKGSRPLRVGSIYLPNGNPVDSEKFPYKLEWMDALADHARDLLALEEAVVLAGDYNVIPEDGDVYDPDGWREDALFRMEVRRKFRALLNLGWTEAYRTL
ncbi:MAG: exodeoxyribonuclease, partial [Pseudomonadota bacterium]